MKVKSTALVFSIALAVFLTACQDSNEIVQLGRYTEAELKVLQETLNLPTELYDYNVYLPNHAMSEVGTTFIFVGSDIATLGRVLFYDKKLSANNEVACASCHFQENAFSDTKTVSQGFEGVATHRNSFSLGSVASFDASYNGGFTEPPARIFWDNRAGSIEEQCQMTITDPIEMGMTINELPEKLAKEKYYQILFKKAFQEEGVTFDKVVTALAQFVRSMNTTNTRFDAGLTLLNDPTAAFSNFSTLENQGKTLYLNHCAACHGERAIKNGAGKQIASNGLDATYTDNGMGVISGNPAENGVFKVPILRNVALSAPYMHDGRFATLEQVIDHYSTGIKAHTNLDPLLREPNGQPKRFNFTQDQKDALVAFLNTLTDYAFITQDRYSDPFRK